jgi:hypothetical protein
MISPDAIEKREKELGRKLTLEDLGELVDEITRAREKRRSPHTLDDRDVVPPPPLTKKDKARIRRAAERLKRDTCCWRCRHLTSRIHTAPPVYCKAFPRGAGIPFMVLGGIVRHDHLLGDEEVDVTFERDEERKR